MPTDQEYAQLANHVYDRTPKNRTPVPAGWSEVAWIRDEALTGFSAGVYRKGNDVVIAYTGTNESKVADTFWGNLPAFTGAFPSVQVWEAMKLYLEVSHANPGANITFTGHSLGGGLAAMMAVFFDQKATVFDAAPFEAGARSPVALTYYNTQMSLADYADPAFASYVASAGLLFFARESNATGYWLEGEFLSSLRLGPTTIGTYEVVPAGEQTAAAVALHSMTALAAMRASTMFADAVRNTPNLLAMILDGGPYFRDPQSSREQNFIDLLYVAQVSGSAPLLDRFGADVAQFARSPGGTTAQSSDLQKAILVAAMEYYYFKDAANTTGLFTTAAGAVNFKLTDIGVPTYQLKSPIRLADAVWSLAEDAGVVAQSAARSVTSWHVQTGSGSMSWAGADSVADAALGGTGADTLDGGSGSDLLLGLGGADSLLGSSGDDTLIGGDGNDMLDGGTGSDAIYGGVGNDTYHFTGRFGSDLVVDSDGQGKVDIDGVGAITGKGAKKRGSDATTWQTDDKRVTYTIVRADASRQDLIIAVDSGGTSGSITVRNWTDGRLGIELSEVKAPADTRVLTGGPDMESAEPDKTLDGLGGNDVLASGSNANELVGSMGDDILFGGKGADTLDGGEDNDFLNGGEGHDLILGGAGDDIVLGLSNYSSVSPHPDDAQKWEDWATGLRWEWGKGSEKSGERVAYIEDTPILTAKWTVKSAGLEAYFSSPSGESDVSASDTVFGGAGDDLIAGTSGNDVLSGDAGKDVLFGNDGDDAIYGGDDDDEMVGGDGADYMDGGAGADVLFAGYESDTLFGGDGSDTMHGDLPRVRGSDAPPASADTSRYGDDHLDGEEGDDFLFGGGGKDTLEGGDGKDEQHGDANDDELYGGSGDDRLWGDDDTVANLDGATHGKDYLDGEDGADYLEGGGSDDQLFGGLGNDSLYGDSSASRATAGIKGNDYLDGEEGDDLIFGGAGQDTLYGGDGNDSLRGDYGVDSSSATSDGNDVLDGENGDDELTGQGGADTLYGSEGNDTLYGDATDAERESGNDGADWLEGGAGDDALFGQGGNDTLSGGGGSDSLVGGGGDDALDAGSGTDTLFGVEGADLLSGGDGADYLDGGEGDDRLSGDSGDDTLRGDAGNDTLNAGDGNNILDGGFGNDRLEAGSGNDSLWGGSGADAVLGGAGADYLDGGDGDDTLMGDDGADSLLGGDGADRLESGTGNDTLSGADGNDALNGGAGNDYLDGGASDDQLMGGSGLDTLNGAAGNDVISGGDGDDALDGAVGNDQLNGDAGNDSLWGDAGIDALSGGSGSDYLDGGDGNDTLTGGDGLDTLFGGVGNDMLSGSEGGDALNGGFGNDQLNGDAGDDDLWGDAGDDDLRGGDGVDNLIGGDGNDTLDGGGGDDYLSGGEGDDVYVFGMGSGNDYVESDLDVNDPEIRHTFNVQLKGVSRDDIQYARSGNSSRLSLVLPDGLGLLGIEDFFSWLIQDLLGISRCDPHYVRITFDDGTTLDFAQLAARSSVTTLNDDLLVAYGVADALYVPGVSLLGNEGNDKLFGRDGADRVEGGTGADSIYGGGASDTLLGGTGNDQLWGDEGADHLDGGEGYDQLEGGAGNDTLTGGGGLHFGQVQSDYLAGGDGNDVYVFERGFGHDLVSDLGTEGASFDTLRLGSGISAGDLTLTREWGNRLFVRLKETDDVIEVLNQFYPTSPGDTIDRGIEQISFADGTVWDAAMIEAKAVEPASVIGSNLIGTTRKDSLVGGAANDSLQGNEGDDTLEGGPGQDTLDGGLGNDTYRFNVGSGHDVISSVDPTAGKSDVIRLGPGITPANLKVNVIYYATLEGDLLLSVPGTSDSIRVDGFFANDAAAGNQIEKVIFSDGSFWSVADIKARAIIATEQDDQLQGYSTADVLSGAAGDDVISGLGGSDSISGGLGEDSLMGGDGDDLLDGGTQNDIANGDAGNDIVRGGDGNDRLYGGAGNDLVSGGAGDDMLSGGDQYVRVTGTDTLDGGMGNDSLFGSEGNDIFLFGKGDGQDQFDGYQSNVGERDVLRFKADVGSSDVAVARVFDKNLRGGAYWLELTIVSTGERIRTADFFDVDGALSAYHAIQQVEFSDGTVWDLQTLVRKATLVPLDGTAGDDSLVGAIGSDYISGLAGADTLIGGGGDDWLDGGTGQDSLIGGLGNDTYVVDSVEDVVVEAAGEGADTVIVGINWALTEGLENLTLTGAGAVNGTGNASGNVLTGNNANNILDGAGGADTMQGGLGDDTYIVDQVGDVVSELSGGGIDTVLTSLSYTLGAALENLTLTGTATVAGAGNALANVIRGNSGSNILTGLAGVDTLIGGVGNDTYRIDTASDVIVELDGEGLDVVESAVTVTLAANVENLMLIGNAAVNGTGNALNNGLTGNGAANRLDGGAGVDTMTGAAGNDTYVVDNASDVAVETAAGGIDTVESSVSYTLGGEIEVLRLTGSKAINGTGNKLANTLTGNGAANRLDGGAGADTMTGGAGADTYVVDNAGDLISELAAGGLDTVESSISWKLGAELEKLTLTGTSAVNGTGNALANTLMGNGGANRLDGGAGADSMKGGAGNDTYVVDNVGDIVTEAASGGADTIESSITWVLGAELENLTLTGASAINATGNGLANTLRGNAGANVLTGGAGNDTMVGGAGNDIYVVDAAADVVTENAGEGTDTVRSAVTWTLGANVENLTLTGSHAINGTGTAAANTLIGNSGANVMTGAGGDDIYDGGAGNDIFNDAAATSNDTYRWGIGSGFDTLTDAGGSLDHVDMFAGITKNQLRFAKSGNDLLVGISSQTDKLTIKNWYVGTANQIEEFRLSDGSKVLASQVGGLLTAMSSFGVIGAPLVVELAPEMRSLPANHAYFAVSALM